MPIFDLGYRPWKGTLRSPWMRWWVITRAGLAQSWKIGWLRRTLLFAWGPALLFGSVFAIYELGKQNDFFGPMIEGFTSWVTGEPQEEPTLPPIGIGPMGIPPLGVVEDDPEISLQKHRRAWNWLFAAMTSYSQQGFVIVVLGLAAPPLISSDLRTRAFLIYFSRPITRSEYLFGKAAVLWIFQLVAFTLPVLAIYVVAALLSSDRDLTAASWDIPLRIAASSAVMLIPTTGLALAFSSLSTEQRTPTFLWYAVWAIGGVAFAAVWSQQYFGNEGEVNPHWSLLSLFSSTTLVNRWIFGLEESWFAAAPELALLAGVAVLAFGFAWYRIAGATNA